jgi:uncharacterized protein YlxW (UPF0749 family)
MSDQVPATPAPVRRRHARRPVGSLTLLFLMLASAGMLFATSARTADGAELRSDPADTVGLLRAQQDRNAERAAQVQTLQEEIDALTAAAAGSDSTVAALQQRSAALLGPAGLQAVTGPALEVTLDDAPRNSPLVKDAQPDDVIVHQQDVQSVVNALWAGGAEAIQLMDQRVISTSAVRCVGNTLILQGRVYSPPYRIVAIGPVDGMRRAIDASPSIDLYLEYANAFGLGWTVRERKETVIPAYSGPLRLRYAIVPGAAAGDTPATSSASTSGS